QRDLPRDHHFTTLEWFLELQFLPSIEDAYGNDEAIETIEELLEERRTHADSDLNDEEKKDIIDYLLKHELEEAQNCVTNNPKEDANCIDEDDLEHNNPCAKPDKKPAASVKDIARQMQRYARKQLLTRGSKDELKANASQGTYKKNGNPSDLKENICKITLEHSNDSRSAPDGEPCKGKDGSNGGVRMKIGNGWTHLQNAKTTYSDVFLPPRRQHMCTSNLENLETNCGPLHVKDPNCDKVNHSFLGDVLLSAKKEGDFISKNFNKENPRDPGICRALKYSFADIGDIIRGKDLFYGNPQEKKQREQLDDKLKTIFGKIHDKLGDSIKSNYNDTKNFYQLREDWWSANRIKIWSAMKCALKSDNIQCRMTPDDYIPQRLRWMTEWAEWFCKMQKEAYNELKGKCSTCMNKNKGADCKKNTTEYENCKGASDVYKTKIKPWADQWDIISKNYEKLYKEVEIAAGNGGLNTSTAIKDNEDKPVIEFLFELYKENGGKISTPSDTHPGPRVKRGAPSGNSNTVYSTAAGYIHQEAHIDDCNKQNVFCEKKHGVTPPNGEDNAEYTFQQHPLDYEKACGCEDRIKEKVTKPKKQKDACKIVEEIYGTSNNGQNGINRCFPKKGPFVWKCGDKSLVKDEGVCMPPRRKSLCIYILTLQQQTKDEDKLREAFIKCAAAETCLLWHKYKKEKEKKKSYVIGQIAFDEEEEDPQSQLERGQIPDEFKRQMFYTFGDYRDLCLDKDISKKQGPVEDATNNIRNFFSGKNGKSPSGKTPDEGRKAWWDGIKEDVWKGMLCALEKIVKNPSKFTNNSKYSYTTVTFSGDNSPTLEKFAQTPQFLRWFTEWSDDFCIQQKKELKTLENKCNFSTCDDANDNEKKKCHQACWNYKAFLKKWKKQYKKQNIEFEGLRYTDSIIKDKSAPEYLEENCKDKCSCIKEADYTHYNKSFEYPPQNFKDKCNCPLFDKNETDDTNKKSKPKKEDDTYEDFEKCPFENSGNRDGTTVIKNDRCKNLNVNRQCTETKYENDLDQWTGKLVRDSSKDNEGVLMPPRRVHLCTRTITKNKYRTTETDKFKKDLFDSAYNQGFLLGKKFKDYNDEGHEALKNSFADYGDIIRGKDIMETTTPTDIKEKLEKLLKNAEKTAQSNGTTPQPKSVNQWWEQYRTSVWHAMLCGYHQGINGPQTLGRRRGRQSQPVTALTSSPTTKTIPPNWCQLPTDDSTDQFLRWLREWGTQYCKEKQQLKSNMQMPCKSHLDKYGIIEKKNDINPNCLPSLDKYEVWSNNRLPEWDGLSKKFTKDKEKDKYNNVKETSAENYLKQNCSECKCSFKDIEQTHEKSIKGGHDIFVDILDKAQIPGFVEDIAYRYKGINPKCPEDNECNQYQNIACRGLPHDDDTDWKLSFVNDTKTTNKGVLVPPRRRQLCLRVEPKKLRQLKRNVEKFKNFICSSALAETKRLKQVYKDDNNKLLQAIKYSFADIGNVVKGDDMMESPTSKYIGELFNSTKYNAIDRKNWWNENKYHVWESMLCAYRQAAEDTEKNEKCRFPDIESVPQFLRWFQEWTKIFCIKRKTLYDKMVTECQKAECDKNTGNVQGSDCIKACKKYKYYVLKKKIEYEIQSNKYNKEFKTILNNKDASEFLKVECLSLFFSEAPEKNWGDPYETLEETLKNKCTCIKTESKCPKDIYKVDDEKTKQDIVKPTTPSNKTYADEASPKKTEVLPPQPSDNTSDILEKTIPFGIALALGSIAFLFMKKKTHTPVDLFSVINIPKGDYGIPTPKSKNRYIPYKSAQYKGKTYIYMEGDSSGDEKYAFMSDTTDVTSSESEYEELDINDIYVPGSPKYKTLIEVVLEPSKSNGNTLGDMVGTTIFTDEEWNELKQDFISQYIQSRLPMDVPQYDVSKELPMNIVDNVLDDGMHEKPFITSIHDRDLYTGEEISYNINMSTNSMDDPKYESNNVYSGIDLINDSLNSGNQHIDIYDELLKRKENELFGTNHVKQTSIHSVAKPI
ncbi:hypothetical protein PFMC_06060, partial [Plasmodium falciparum CAMP/Malaysia]